MNDQPSNQDSDEFLSTLDKIKQRVIRYVRTLSYVWWQPDRLLSAKNAAVGISSNSATKPIPPIEFLATTLIIGAAAEKIAFAPSAAFELPPQFSSLERLLSFLPGGSTALFVALAVSFVAVPYWVARLFRAEIPFQVILNAYCYQQVSFGTMFVIVCTLAIALMPNLQYEGMMLHSRWMLSLALLLLWIYSLFWLVRQIKREGFDRGRRPVVAGIVLSSLLFGVLSQTSIWPTSTYNAASGSMFPTLAFGDVVLANQWAYRWRKPRAGELVAFRLPRDEDVVYVKRLVGLPGDRIQMIDGVLNINGMPVPRRRVEDFVTDEDGVVQRVKQYRETLPNGASYNTIDITDNGFYDNTPVYTVPPDEYFMIGDNRDNSTDSRVLTQVGYIPSHNLIGPIYRRLLPPSKPLPPIMPEVN
jgi:signal peptidase I